ncbi:MAG: NUDIX hydrolase [Sinobacteraceae bacterium]|nr:NUDIX hydrolase [Nevskiaceae bacterium]
MADDPDWLRLARELASMAQAGLTFTRDHFDNARYRRLQEIAAHILAQGSDPAYQVILESLRQEQGYMTPKVDVRGAVFRDGRVLLVQEITDGKWTLPGGWVDVGDSPASAVEREIREESGYLAKAVKLAALFDKNNPAHGHPPSILHIFKLFFLCEITGGTATLSNETDGVDFFPVSSLPPLSIGRTTQSQIARLFEHHLNRSLPTDFD